MYILGSGGYRLWQPIITTSSQKCQSPFLMLMYDALRATVWPMLWVSCLLTLVLQHSLPFSESRDCQWLTTTGVTSLDPSLWGQYKWPGRSSEHFMTVIIEVITRPNKYNSNRETSYKMNCKPCCVIRNLDLIWHHFQSDNKCNFILFEVNLTTCICTYTPVRSHICTVLTRKYIFIKTHLRYIFSSQINTLSKGSF